MRHKRFPFQLNSYGHIKDADRDTHLRDMMEQILFTIPGERINRPDFGCGVQMMVFDSTQAELLAVKQVQIQTELLKYLGDMIRLENVEITHNESQVSVLIRYASLIDHEVKEVYFQR